MPIVSHDWQLWQILLSATNDFEDIGRILAIDERSHRVPCQYPAFIREIDDPSSRPN